MLGYKYNICICLKGVALNCVCISWDGSGSSVACERNESGKGCEVGGTSCHKTISCDSAFVTQATPRPRWLTKGSWNLSCVWAELQEASIVQEVKALSRQQHHKTKVNNWVVQCFMPVPSISRLLSELTYFESWICLFFLPGGSFLMKTFHYTVISSKETARWHC